MKVAEANKKVFTQLLLHTLDILYYTKILTGGVTDRDITQERDRNGWDGGAVQEVHREGQVRDKDARPKAEPKRSPGSISFKNTAAR